MTFAPGNCCSVPRRFVDDFRYRTHFHAMSCGRASLRSRGVRTDVTNPPNPRTARRFGYRHIAHHPGFPRLAERSSSSARKASRGRESAIIVEGIPAASRTADRAAPECRTRDPRNCARSLEGIDAVAAVLRSSAISFIAASGLTAPRDGGCLALEKLEHRRRIMPRGLRPDEKLFEV